MKKATNFRLSHQAIVLLGELNNELHLSKTEILERALLGYAKRKLSTKTGLAKLAGVLSEEQADKWLSIIESSRVNKDEDTKL